MKLEKKNCLKMLLSSELQYSMQSIYADSSSIDSSNLRIQGTWFSKNSMLSQDYLCNFENSFKLGAINSTSDFMTNPQNIISLMQPQYKETYKNVIRLSKPRKLKIDLGTVLATRNSSRYFSKNPLYVQELSDFLLYTAGAIKTEGISVFNNEIEKPKFSYPSGGGMYSISLFLMIYNVKNIEPGGYIYQPITHTLRKVSELIALEEFIVTKRYDKTRGDYVEIENFTPSVLICCINNFTKQRFKYGELSLALAYTDCGCLLQNAGLMATALNLEFCVWAGFKKSNAENLLKIDGINNHIIMTALMGKK